MQHSNSSQLGVLELILWESTLGHRCPSNTSAFPLGKACSPEGVTGSSSPVTPKTGLKRRPPQGNHTHTPPATPQKDAPDLAQNATPRAAPLPAARSWPRTGLPSLPVPRTSKPYRPEALTLRPPRPRRAAVRSRHASLTAV